MLRRLLLGLCEGLVIGLALGVACARALGVGSLGAAPAAALGAFAGFLVGLVAGRPIWARNAKTEALLKAGAGALGGCGLAFAGRHWLKMQVDLSAYSLGSGTAGQLAVVLLPALSTVLALFFELDDQGENGSGKALGKQTPRQRFEAELPEPMSADELEPAADDVEHETEKR